MQDDLVPFPNVDFDKMRESIVKTYDRPGSVSLCHYVIQSNKVNTIAVCNFKIWLRLYMN